MYGTATNVMLALRQEYTLFATFSGKHHHYFVYCNWTAQCKNSWWHWFSLIQWAGIFMACTTDMSFNLKTICQASYILHLNLLLMNTLYLLIKIMMIAHKNCVYHLGNGKLNVRELNAIKITYKVLQWLKA